MINNAASLIIPIATCLPNMHTSSTKSFKHAANSLLFHPKKSKRNGTVQFFALLTLLAIVKDKNLKKDTR